MMLGDGPVSGLSITCCPARGPDEDEAVMTPGASFRILGHCAIFNRFPVKITPGNLYKYAPV